MTVVNRNLNANSPIRWESSVFGTTSFSPKYIYNDISQISRGVVPFDVVILSSSSLQDFQTTSQSLIPYIDEKTTIMIESTGFINLEPFVSLSLPKLKNLSICSIMNEYDVRHLGSNTYSHKIRGQESRMYLGHCTNNKNSSFKKIIKAFNLIQEDSKGKFSLLVANSSKEFQTYQWKLALPRIIFNPLSIIFETEFPEQLSQQILCKPLVTGLITEIFKIIKKMECKLVKGTENETNLWKIWKELYPQVESRDQNDKFLDSPGLFYNYYKQYDLDIDLLLLQPILLADDHGIRTPYLENLYSIMCQYIKVNGKGSKSIFFKRRENEFDEQRNNQLNIDYDFKSKNINKLTGDLNEMEQRIKSLDLDQKNKELKSLEINEQVSKQEIILRSLTSTIKDQEEKCKILDREISEKKQQLVEQEHIKNASLTNQTDPISTPKISRESFIASPRGLQEMSDIALYGANLNGEDIPKLNMGNNGEHIAEESDIGKGAQSYSQGGDNYPNGNGNYQQPPPQQQSQQVPPSGREKLKVDTQYGSAQPKQNYYNPQQQQQHHQQNQYQQMPMPQQHQSYNNLQNFSQMQPQYGHQNQYYGNQQQGGQGGFLPSPMDQHPPHGLPSNGLPHNTLPAPLLGSNSMTNVNRYQQMPQHKQNGHPQKQRLSSIPSSMGSYYDPSQQGPNFGGNQMMPNNGMGMNGAKVTRRSMYPTAAGLGAMDMGGRGGMPMPTGPTGERPQGGKARPMSSMGNLNSPPGVNLRKSQFSPPSQPRELQIPPQQLQHLHPPNANRSNTSSVSSNTNDTPKTSHSKDGFNDEIQLNVPEIAAKPLGGVKSDKDEGKKKKKGFFGKKK